MLGGEQLILNLKTMKTQTVVTDVTKGDLVNLLSTAHYGSYWLGLDYKAGNNTNQNGSFEDKLASILLEGKKIVFIDFNVDDEEDVYGNLPHHFNKSEGAMYYDVTLKDIETGIAKAFDKGGFENQCANYLVYEPENLDLYEAEALMQMCVFGELIYG